MEAHAKLKEIASDLAGQAQQRKATLERELTKVEAEKRKIELELNAASLAHQRLAEFRGLVGGRPICPRCWIKSGAQTTMTERSSPSRSEDRFFCDGCGLDINLPAR